jgi:hypothetical protein
MIQLNPIYTLMQYFLGIHGNIVLASHLQQLLLQISSSEIFLQKFVSIGPNHFLHVLLFSASLILLSCLFGEESN